MMEQELVAASDPATLIAFLTSLAIGLLMGLERERKPSTKAGLRTFGLVAMLGTLSALVSDRLESPWIVAAGLAVVGGMMVVAYRHPEEALGDPGTTSVVALMVCYLLGVLAWLGELQLAVALAIVATALLYFKAELHGIASRLSQQDWVSIIQFAVLALVILPLLPDQGYGPHGALNPFHVWWMVVLIAGVSLAGYAALRLAGPAGGAALSGVLGGLVSSTATTLVFSRHARANPDFASSAILAIVLANLTVQIRLAILAVVVAPGIAPLLHPVLGAGLAGGLLAGGVVWLRSRPRSPSPDLPLTNPTELRTALGFGVFFAGVLLVGAWLSDVVGNAGLYGLAAVSGLTDVDAIALSSLRLYNLDQLAGREAVTAVLVALISNFIVKSGIVIVVGGRNVARHAVSGLAAITGSMVLAWAMLVR